MVEVEGSVEASMVFEKLYSDYIRAQKDDAILVKKRLEYLRDEFPILEDLQIEQEGRVSVNLRKGDVRTIVETMSKIFNSLIDVVSYTKGSERAFKDAERIVLNVRKQFEVPFTRLNLQDHLLYGALRSTVTTGTNGMDELLLGGIPMNKMVLLFGPPGKERFRFAYQYIAEGLRNNGGALVITSAMSVDEMRGMLTKLDVNVSSCESKGRLMTIDWYTQKSRAIVGMEEHGSVLVPSKDIANLDIAFGTALDRISFAPTKRALVDVITPALNAYDLPDVVEFVQRQKTRLKREGITSLFLVEQGAHDERVMSTLKHLSDGVINLIKEPGGDLFIEIESMGNSQFEKGRFAVQMSQRGLAVVGETLDETELVTEFMQLPDVDASIARRLIDAGYMDLESLYSAGKEDLLKINGINEVIAGKIREYTGTVEFSQRVLKNRSDKWLRKAREQAKDGTLDRAVKSIERALEIDPNNALAWLELSQMAQLEGNVEGSREYYDKALKINPNIEHLRPPGQSSAEESQDRGGEQA